MKKKNMRTISVRVDIDEYRLAKKKCLNLAHAIRWVIEQIANDKLSIDLKTDVKVEK